MTTNPHAEIRRVEARLDKLAGERPGLARARLLGEPEAAERLAAADAETAEWQSQLGELRAAAATAEQAARQQAAASAARETAARPAAIARLRQEALAADGEIGKTAAALRAAIDRKYAAERGLDAALDSAHFSRTRQALLTSIPSTIAHHFVIDRGRPMNMQGNSLLGMVTSLIGPEIALSLHDRDQRRLDDLVRCFATRDEAAVAQARLMAGARRRDGRTGIAGRHLALAAGNQRHRDRGDGMGGSRCGSAARRALRRLRG